MNHKSEHSIYPAPTTLGFKDREIARLTRHLRWHDAIQRLIQGVLIALALNCTAAFAARLLPLWYRETLVYALFWSTGISALLAGLVGRFWPSPFASRLRRLDLGLELADRLTTLWELSTGRIATSPTLFHAQRTETLHYLHAINPSEVFPLHPHRRAKIIALTLSLLFALMLLLPNPQEAELNRREAQMRAKREALARLEQLAETLAQSPSLTEAQQETTLQALNEALATLRTPTASVDEQQLALTKVEQHLAALRSLADETQATHTSRILRLSEAAASASRPQSAENAAIINPLTEAIQQGDLETAAAYLRALTAAEGEALSSEEISALADTFNALANALQTTDPTLAEQFRQISQAMHTQDFNNAREAIQQAADTLSEVDQTYASDRTLEQAQAQVQSAREQLRQSQTRQGSGQQAWTEPSSISPRQSYPSEAADRSQAGTSKQGQPSGSQGSHEDSGSSAPYNPNYPAPRLDSQSNQITIPRSETHQSDPQITNGQPPLARPDGTGQIPYQEVYADYAEAAEAKLSRQAYPPGLRAYIQTYFSTLEE